MSATTTKASNVRSSVWQPGSELLQAARSTDDQTWRITATSRLLLENQFRSNNDQIQSSCSADIFSNISETYYPPLPKPLMFYGRCNQVVQPDRWHKTLPPSETLPRNEVLGGYIFVCNNETMQDDLRRQLFGLPHKYKDSVRAITPGLPLFLYNYTSHQMHGVYQAVSFGGSNIDPTAWEDKKCRGESRFPAQVRIRIKRKCKPLEEDAFRPILHHYDGPKFRLQLSVPEALALLDLFKEEDM
ncbi:B2 protein-like isoform X2 [Macadamia integrifolia]|nr:B2 protein-like isoform X2 [Macadamia integrifolia]XP_042476301.1 B2 protein-like isoform X2 [Macadamia integrifolia]